MKTLFKFIAASFLVLVFGACDQRMAQQPKYEELEASQIFTNEQAALHPPEHTISIEQPELLNQAPSLITFSDLQRGQERYRIYCVPCHGELGDGKGAIVARGFPAPPSYHLERLRKAPLRHFYQVMSEGYGVMYDYANRVTPDDRWRIALYIRALQFSQALPSKSLVHQGCCNRGDP